MDASVTFYSLSKTVRSSKVSSPSPRSSLEQKFADPTKFKIQVSGRKRNHDADPENFDAEKPAPTSHRNEISIFDAAVSTKSRISAPKNETSGDVDAKPNTVEMRKKLKDPTDFRKFSKEELVSRGILVQKRRYKSAKTLPIVGGTSVTTEKGQMVVFYKRKRKIWMDIGGKIFVPDVEPDHVAGIFRDYSEEELLQNDLGQVPTHLPSCPLCSRRFPSQDELVKHCASCEGDKDDQIR